MKRFRLGILQVNHDKSAEVGDQFPDDSHRFRDLLDRLDMRFEYRIYMTIGGELPDDIDEQDGYLITGSPLSVLDDSLTWRADLFRFIEACDAAQKPLVGVCFGHQAIAVALGGEVQKRQGGYNVGVETTRFHQAAPFMRPDARTLDLYMFHEDEVSALPEGAEVIGTSDGCAIAAYKKQDHIFCLQAHPEFHDRFMHAVLEFSRQHMPAQIYQGARASIEKPTDGLVFAKWLEAFFSKRLRG